MTIAIEDILTKDITTPARYLGNELGAVHKPWDTARVRWVLTYPEVYEVGSSNLGHIILYNILNAQPRQLCDRAYLPAPDLAAKLRTTGIPLFAVENRRAITDFDILGFSLSYELGATNILEMLSLAGIPLTWRERNVGAGLPDNLLEKQITSQENPPSTPLPEKEITSQENPPSTPLAEKEITSQENPPSTPWAEKEITYQENPPSTPWAEKEITYQENPPSTPQEKPPFPIPHSPFPLIFAGGQTATSNPEPYADFFDFIALGDGEELLPEIGLVIEEGKKAGLSREELLLDLAQIPGVYVPQFYDMAEDGSVHPNRPDVPPRILRRVATPIPEYSIGLVPYIETVHDRLKIEVRRGCTRGCRFCQPGMLTRPARDVEPEKVVEAIEKGMRATGYNEFSLLSLSCSDYLALPAVGMEIKNRLKDENISLSLPSQRVDRFDENIANILGGTRQGGLTFAPEAGTQRMRDIVNKGLTNEELLRGVKTAFEQGWDKIKLYFMIGLPGEMDEDILGIAETVEWLQQECRGKGRKRLNFNITISNFTPKPHTPFQWHSVSTSEFGRKQKLLKDAFRQVKGVKVNYTDIRISAMEDFIGRGDRRLASVVRRAWELGAGMDAWFDNLEKAFAAWENAIAESDLTWKYRQVENGEWNVFHSSDSTIPKEGESMNVIGYASKLSQRLAPTETPDSPFHTPLPWDHIDTGIDKNWLIADLQRALEAATVPDCSFDGCSHCGICGTDFGHNIVVKPLPIPEFAGQFTPDTTKAQRLRVWFGKRGDMTFLSHLDMVRLFDRTIRRASLPIAFTGGYHPSPRIMIANALSLGVSSSGEIADFELTESVNIEEFKEKLVSKLPSDIPIYRVEEVDLKAPAGTQILERAEYLLTVAVEEDATFEEWKSWLDKLLATEVIEWEHTTKSGKKSKVNLRDRTFELEVVESKQYKGQNAVILRYVGSCRNDGTMLRADHIIYMLEQVVQREFQVLHVHRQRLILGEM